MKRGRKITQSIVEGKIVPEIPEFDIETYKSIYRIFNAKPEVDTKFLRGRKKITIADLKSLDEILQEKLKNLNVITNMSSVDVIFHDKRATSFPNISDFLNNNWNTSQKIKTLIFKWNFSIKLEKYSLPQPHSITLRLGSKPKPSEILHVIVDQDDEEMDEYFSSAVCRVEYVNLLTSEELINIVNKWYEGLYSINEVNKVEKFIERFDKQIVDFFPYMLMISTLILSYSVVNNFINIPPNITDWNLLFKGAILGLVIASALILISLFVGKMIGHYIIYHTIMELKIYTMFDITNGDKVKNGDIKKDNQKIINKLFSWLIGLMATNILYYFAPILIKSLLIKH